MARKRKEKKKYIPKKRPPDRRPQSERFKEAAKMVEADESGKKFESVFAKVVKPRTG
jgi:hypothetical protein